MTLSTKDDYSLFAVIQMCARKRNSCRAWDVENSLAIIQTPNANAWLQSQLFFATLRYENTRPFLLQLPVLVNGLKSANLY